MAIAFISSCNKEEVIITDDAEVYLNPIVNERENQILMSADSNLYLLNRYSDSKIILKSNIGNLKRMVWHPSRNKFACICYEKDSILVIDRNGDIESRHARQGINTLLWNRSGSALLGLTGYDVTLRTVIGTNTYQPSALGMNVLHGFCFIDDDSYAMSYQTGGTFSGQHMLIQWQGVVNLSHSTYYLDFNQIEFFENQVKVFCKSNSYTALFDPTNNYTYIPAATYLSQFKNPQYSPERDEYLGIKDNNYSYSLVVYKRDEDQTLEFNSIKEIYESETEIYDCLW